MVSARSFRTQDEHVFNKIVEQSNVEKKKEMDASVLFGGLALGRTRELSCELDIQVNGVWYSCVRFGGVLFSIDRARVGVGEKWSEV